MQKIEFQINGKNLFLVPRGIKVGGHSAAQQPGEVFAMLDKSRRRKLRKLLVKCGESGWAAQPASKAA